MQLGQLRRAGARRREQRTRQQLLRRRPVVGRRRHGRCPARPGHRPPPLVGGPGTAQPVPRHVGRLGAGPLEPLGQRPRRRRALRGGPVGVEHLADDVVDERERARRSALEHPGGDGGVEQVEHLVVRGPAHRGHEVDVDLRAGERGDGEQVEAGGVEAARPPADRVGQLRLGAQGGQPVAALGVGDVGEQARDRPHEQRVAARARQHRLGQRGGRRRAEQRRRAAPARRAGRAARAGRTPSPARPAATAARR